MLQVNLKRIALFALSIILALPLLISCGKSGSGDATTTEESEQTEKVDLSEGEKMEKIRQGSFGLSVGETIDLVENGAGDSGLGSFPARVLQGVINKKQARIYYTVGAIMSDGIDTEYEQRLILEKYGEVELEKLALPADIKTDGYAAFHTMFAKYSGEIENIYVYSDDEFLQDTRNIAAMLASRNSGVAVDEALLAELRAMGCTLPVTNVVEYCGFDESDNYITVNQWIADNMVEGSNPDMVFCLSTRGRDGEIGTNLPWAFDIAVATGSLIYYVDPNVTRSCRVQEAILNKYRDNIPVIGWSSWKNESSYVSAINRLGKYVCCIDWGFANGSVWAAFPPFDVSAYELETREDYEPAEVNICLMVSDGDAWHYSTKELISAYSHSLRGKEPISWTIASQFVKFDPLLLSWLYDTKSPLDTFVQGPSGVGYIYPSLYPEDAYGEFLSQTRDAIAKLGVDIVNFWDLSDNNGMVGKDDAIKARYAKESGAVMLLLGHSSHTGRVTTEGDVLLIEEFGDFEGRGCMNGEDLVRVIDKARANSEGKPIYICANIEAWGEQLHAVDAAIELLLARGDEGSYKFCTPYELYRGIMEK